MNMVPRQNLLRAHFVLFSILFCSALVGISASDVRAQDAEATVSQPQGKLIIFRSFSTDSSKRYFMGKKALTDFKGMLSAYLSDPYKKDPRIQTIIVGLGTETEQDNFENRIYSKCADCKFMKDFVNFQEVDAISAEHGAQLALLISIKSMSMLPSKETEKIGDYIITKEFHQYGFELSFILYDVVNKEILHDETLVASDKVNSKKDSTNTNEFYEPMTKITRTPEGVIIADDNLITQMNAMLNTLGMKNFKYLITVLQSKAKPMIYDKLVEKSLTDIPGRNVMVVMSSVRGNDDVRTFAYVPEMKGFDTAVPTGGMYDGIPNYNEDGVFITTGDFDGDGKDELVISAGYDYIDRTESHSRNKFMDTQIRIYSWKDDKFDRDAPMAILNHIFDEGKTGAYVAAGDFDGDGADELVVSQCNWYDHVKVIDYRDGAFVTEAPLGEIENLFTQKKGHETGGYAAAGDFDGDGFDEIAISKAAGEEQIKILKIMNGKLSVMGELDDLFLNYDQGVTVAAGDFNGDKVDELVLSSVNGNDDVRILSFRNGAFDTQKYFAQLFDQYKNYDNGVSVAAGDFDNCGADEIVLVPNAAEDDVRILKYTKGRFETFSGLYDMYSGYTGGLNIATGNF